MKRDHFNRLLGKIVVGRQRHRHVETSLIPTALTNDERRGMVLFLVRQRKQIIKLLIPDDWTPEEASWLTACGYLYETTSPTTKHLFVHTSENKIY